MDFPFACYNENRYLFFLDFLYIVQIGFVINHSRHAGLRDTITAHFNSNRALIYNKTHQKLRSVSYVKKFKQKSGPYLEWRETKNTVIIIFRLAHALKKDMRQSRAISSIVQSKIITSRGESEKGLCIYK